MLAGCCINLIGPHTLQNSLLAACIIDQTGAECAVIDSNNEPLKFPSNQKPSLNLIDTQEDTLNKVQSKLVDCRKNGPIDQRLAFFNAIPRGRIEELVLPPEVLGIFYLNQPTEILIKGLCQLFDGELWLPRRLLNKLVLKNSPTSPLADKIYQNNLLTTREIQILNLLSTGAKNSDIAQKMCLSIHTIKTHIYHIYKKLEVKNRTQAVRWASQHLLSG